MTRRTSLRQALTRCVCRIEGARAPGDEAKTMTALLAWSLSEPPGTAAGINRSEALKWRSHTAPEAVACSVPDSVMSVVTTDEVRREHDTAGGYEHEP